MKISEAGEFGLIERLIRIAGKAPGGEIWAGDDCAVVGGPGEEALVTTDLLVEKVHFDLQLTGPSDLGYKAMAANLSDIAAMGGTAWRAVAALALRPELDMAWVEDLFSGMAGCAGQFGCGIIGGDITRGDCLTIAVTALGRAGEAVVFRSGALPGDAVAVTGTLGASAAGYRLLRAGNRERSDLLDAHRRPVPRLPEAEALVPHRPTAMIDISDGLVADLGHICEASEVGVVVEASALPMVDLSGLGIDRGALQLALGGGEDYELCFTIASGRFEAASAAVTAATGTPVSRIGEIVEDTRGRVLLIEGDEEPLVAPGWDHLRV
ncbi:MAG: thiamine-phosphate kinase [Actinomycetota bacterium]